MLITSNIGKKVVVSMPDNTSKRDIKKFQGAADHISAKLTRRLVEDFIWNHTYKKKYYSSRAYNKRLWYTLWLKKKVKYKSVYLYTKTHTGFYVDRSDCITRNMSKKKMVDLIMNSDEINLKRGKNGIVEIFQEIDERNVSGVLGYTFVKAIKQWVYRRYLEAATKIGLAGHQCHELGHKLGMRHTVGRHANRKDTLCYAFGYWVGSKL